MSNDANMFYQLGLAITTGKFSKLVMRLFYNLKLNGYMVLESSNCGTLIHSRWLTTAIAILFLYCSYHGLNEEEEEKLRLLPTFKLQH